MKSKWPLSSLHVWIWYFLFGGIHELFHWLALSGPNGFWSSLLPMILGRCVLVSPTQDEHVIFWARHVGWMGSCLIAWALHSFGQGRLSKEAILAARVTALEALVTDLFGFTPWSPYYGRMLFCGNFGIILLNPNWINVDHGQTALNVLEKMVNVTMMRGAQCGGVVTFVPKSNNTASSYQGIRCRTVNGKRTDLSKRVRSAVERRVPLGQTNHKGVQGFFGHTRFATTSKATLDGCHPHQWTPPSNRRVYDFQTNQVRTVQVGNYITHNGDLDFFTLQGTTFDLGTIQSWLVQATGVPMPTTVDSAAIAGLVDIMRTQGCFALSARYAVCMALDTSTMTPSKRLPTFQAYEQVGLVFEQCLATMLTSTQAEGCLSLEDMGRFERQRLVGSVLEVLLEVYTESLNDTASASSNKKTPNHHLIQFFNGLSQFMDAERGVTLRVFVEATVHAFFDNDLLHTTKRLLKQAKGSFGLCITSSLDAHRQVCFAARGQTMSIAFYPRKGLVCYGSEQAAVKAGISYSTPGGDLSISQHVERAEDTETIRLDLDDLGGEICLLDWSAAGVPLEDREEALLSHIVSLPNRHLETYRLMDGTLRMILLQETQPPPSKTQVREQGRRSSTMANAFQKTRLWERMTLLEGNELIKPLLKEKPDLVLADIQDIPRVCAAIQDDWQDVGLNRLTAWHLQKCIQKRLKAIVQGKISRHAGCVDILLTGCEVSLWLAEQMATDLQKSFPKLFIQSISSNKLLGLFGQDLSIPCVGYPMSQRTHDFKDTIVLIVSHSGGTFAPLACSNLLQSMTRNIFVVASEWDTQIGKQLRSIHDPKQDYIISSRIFTTEVGVRPAEPCSVSVAATQQLLTNLFQHIALSIISDASFRHASGAVITEYDLKVLETLNRNNIHALESIVGVDCGGYPLTEICPTEANLRAVGDIWANHILENARAYIMTFIYIVVTVTIGHPLISGLAQAFGLRTEWAFYITRFLDSLIYFWMPQINITILRLIEGRNWRHRMVGRTVVIGDCPWVAQAGEAFLSKIFACSYSIAGCQVISGNPADHLVHRHTHRVVRGTLLVCGRPDGRLSALTSLEASVCLSVNQASSIQSMGGTCESVTIGHNPFKLPLSRHAIVLETTRPKFLCEHVLDEREAKKADLILDNASNGTAATSNEMTQNWPMMKLQSKFKRTDGTSNGASKRNIVRRQSRHSLASEDEELHKSTSNHGRLLGIYSDMQQEKAGTNPLEPERHNAHASFDAVLGDLLSESDGLARLKRIFNEIDDDGNGSLDQDEFVAAFKLYDASMSEEAIRKMFAEADADNDGTLDFEEFVAVAKMPQANMISVLQTVDRSERGLSLVQPTSEHFFGEELRQSSPPNISTFSLIRSQHFAMELYESRIASLQRFVSMTVMFHQMGRRVETFFERISFGLWGYRMDRTHSIMRIATTASPVSGADVRERMEILRMVKTIHQSVAMIERTWLDYKRRTQTNGMEK